MLLSSWGPVHIAITGVGAAILGADIAGADDSTGAAEDAETSSPSEKPRTEFAEGSIMAAARGQT